MFNTPIYGQIDKISFILIWKVMQKVALKLGLDRDLDCLRQIKGLRQRQHTRFMIGRVIMSRLNQTMWETRFQNTRLTSS
jgi:hypothetical protein